MLLLTCIYRAVLASGEARKPLNNKLKATDTMARQSGLMSYNKDLITKSDVSMLRITSIA